MSLNKGASKASRSGIVPAMAPINKAFFPMSLSLTMAKVTAPNNPCVNEPFYNHQVKLKHFTVFKFKVLVFELFQVELL